MVPPWILELRLTLRSSGENGTRERSQISLILKYYFKFSCVGEKVYAPFLNYEVVE